MEIINLCIESAYADTTWCKRILHGIDINYSSKKECIVYIDEDNIQSLKSNSVLMIVGFTDAFILKTISTCVTHKIRPLLVGSNPKTFYGPKTSCVIIDRENAMFNNVNNLLNNGYKHIAMIGVNPSVYTDVSHMDGYRLALMQHGITNYEKDIYYNTESIDNTIDNFLKDVNSYDAVVCTNDYVATYLLSKFNELNIKVPEEIAITGAGNIEMSQYTTPPLTTIDIPLESAGKQAITLYRILSKNHELNYLNATLENKIEYRQSTRMLSKINDDTHAIINDSYVSISNNDYEASMKPIWNIADAFSQFDDTDRKIISEIVANKSNAAIASSIFMSDSALSYRLNKMYSLAHVSGKDELKYLFKKYFNNYKY